MGTFDVLLVIAQKLIGVVAAIFTYITEFIGYIFNAMPQFAKILLILVLIFFGAAFLDGIFFNGFDMDLPYLNQLDLRSYFASLIGENYCDSHACTTGQTMFHFPAIVEVINYFQPNGKKIDKEKLLLCPNLTDNAPDFSDNSHLYDAQFYSGAVATSGTSGFTASGGSGGGGGGVGAGDEFGEVSPAKNCFNFQFPYYCKQNGQDCCKQGDAKCSCDSNGCSPNIGFFKGIAMLFIMLFLLAWGIGRVGFNLGG